MTSAKPSVLTSAVGANAPSSRALVATVVPWVSRSTRRTRKAAIPAWTASVGSSGVDSTFATRPRSSTRSVKVPPVSDPIRIAAECTRRQASVPAADRHP